MDFAVKPALMGSEPMAETGTMSELPVETLRALAVKIATSYTRANPMPVDAIPGVIQSAYQGLIRCVQPPAPPPQPAGRTGRGRRRAVR